MIDKTDVRKTLLAMERADIDAAQRSYDAYFGEATTAGDRVYDPEHAATVVRDHPVSRGSMGYSTSMRNTCTPLPQSRSTRVTPSSQEPWCS